jgi:hypothetical protein
MENPLANLGDETVIYSDNQVKLTNRRISCNYVTIPIEDIECVGTNLRVGFFYSSLAALVVSLVPFYWMQEAPWAAVIGIFLVAASILLLIHVYRTYVELYITAGPHKIRILTVALNKRDYLYNISEKLATAVIEEKKLHSARETAQKSLSPYVDPSMTMLLRMAKKQEKKERKRLEKEAEKTAAGKKENP